MTEVTATIAVPQLRKLDQLVRDLQALQRQVVTELTEESVADRVVPDAGDLEWHGLGAAAVVFKPYPCNHFTHAGVDAALRLRAQGLAPADVTAIELGVAKPVLRTIAEPPEARARPASGYHAAFSGPYTVAAALLGGGLGVSHEDFTDAAARDPRRLALAALVRCVEDERCSASFPHAFPAVLRVTTRTGEELEARVEVNRGGPGNPLSDEELARKFHDNAVRSLPEERAARARGPNARLS